MIRTVAFITTLFAIPSIFLTLALCKAASKARKCEDSIDGILCDSHHKVNHYYLQKDFEGTKI